MLPTDILKIIDDYDMEYVLILIFAQCFYKLDWGSLSENPNAIKLLEQNLDRVYWYRLSLNPSIFRKRYPIKESEYYINNT